MVRTDSIESVTFCMESHGANWINYFGVFRSITLSAPVNLFGIISEEDSNTSDITLKTESGKNELKT